MNLHKILTISAIFTLPSEIVKEPALWGREAVRLRAEVVVAGTVGQRSKGTGRARRAGGAPVEALVVVVLRHMAVDVDPAQQGKDQREGG